MRCIAVLGAPGTGAPELIAQLRKHLAGHADVQITDQIPPQPQQSQALALLMGLHPAGCGADAAQHIQQQQDAQLRQQLRSCGLDYRVIYAGNSSARLNNALHALGLAPADDGARQVRQQAQFDLNRGRTPWSCEKCSDPDCEHRLFTQLLRSEAHQDLQQPLSAARRPNRLNRPKGPAQNP